MTGGAIFLVSVALLILSALMFLRGERKPPVAPDDQTVGLRDPARSTWRRPIE